MRMRSSWGMKVAATVLVAATLVAGCSDDTGGTADASDATTTTKAEESTFQVRTPDGPAATIGGPLEGGKGVYLVAAGPGPSAPVSRP